MAALRGRSEHSLPVATILLFRAPPDHAGKTLQRHQRLAGIGPFLQLLDGDMIERLPAGAAGKKRARDVDALLGAATFVENGGATATAEAARIAGCILDVAREQPFAFGEAKTAAPRADIGRVSGAVGAPAGGGVIVPGPKSGKVDLYLNRTAEAAAGHVPTRSV